MDQATRERVEKRISEKLDGILERRMNELQSDMDNLRIRNPFGSRLVPVEIWKGSKFERSFVTSFGQGVYEQVAYEIAIGSGSFAENQHKEKVTITTWQDEAINNLLAAQRGGSNPPVPDWNAEVNAVSSLSNPATVNADTTFDLYIKRIDGTEEYCSLKTVKPNLDQTEIAKKDMLRILASKTNAKAYLALPYNPYGENNQYGWPIPNKIFDMNNSPAVLIGGAFWNAVGDDPNTYNELLDIFDQTGKTYKEKISKGYLHI